jgi:hypothetical protein
VDKLWHSVIRFKQPVAVTCIRSIRATDAVLGFTMVTAFVIFEIACPPRRPSRTDAYDQALIYLRESVK